MVISRKLGSLKNIAKYAEKISHFLSQSLSFLVQSFSPLEELNLLRRLLLDGCVCSLHLCWLHSPKPLQTAGSETDHLCFVPCNLAHCLCHDQPHCLWSWCLWSQFWAFWLGRSSSKMWCEARGKCRRGGKGAEQSDLHLWGHHSVSWHLHKVKLKSFFSSNSFSYSATLYWASAKQMDW